MVRETSRRMLLANAVIAAALPSARAVANDRSSIVAICRNIRSFHKQHIRLLSAEAGLEDDTPEHVAAMRATDALSAEFVRYADELIAKPVCSWDDVVIRAELVRAHGQFESPPDGGDSYYDDVLSGCDRESRMLRALLSAVLEVGGIGRGAGNV